MDTGTAPPLDETLAPSELLELDRPESLESLHPVEPESVPSTGSELSVAPLDALPSVVPGGSGEVVDPVSIGSTLVHSCEYCPECEPYRCPDGQSASGNEQKPVGSHCPSGAHEASSAHSKARGETHATTPARGNKRHAARTWRDHSTAASVYRDADAVSLSASHLHRACGRQNRPEIETPAMPRGPTNTLAVAALFFFATTAYRMIPPSNSVLPIASAATPPLRSFVAESRMSR